MFNYLSRIPLLSTIKSWLFSSDTSEQFEDEIISDFLNNLKEPESEITTGTISFVTDTGGIIDNKYSFSVPACSNFSTGDKVEFRVNKIKNSVNVSDVRLLEKEDEVKEAAQYFGRILKIEGHRCILVPGNVEISLRGVDLEYSPFEGDFVQLEGNFSNPENYIVKKFSFYTKFSDGKITAWNDESGQGVIANHIYFDKSVIKFKPKEGDRVFYNAVKCKRSDYSWRATDLILKSNPGLPSLSDSLNNNRLGVEINRVDNFFVKIGEKKIIEFEVTNFAKRMEEIINVNITPEESTVKLIDVPNIKTLLPQGTLRYKLECDGSVLGWTEVNVQWRFKRFIITRKVKFKTVKDEVISPPPDSERNVQMVYPVTKFVRPKFVKVKLQQYSIPTAMQDIVSQVGKIWFFDILIKLQALVPDLRQPLNEKTYFNIMHTVLFLEEICLNKQIDELHITAPLHLVNNYYVFTFSPDGPYSRFLPGDIVTAALPWDKEVRYNGTIWDVSSKQLFIQFHVSFSSIFKNAAVYDLFFKLNRTPRRKEHQAVDLVIKQSVLKRLFPTSVPFESKTTVALVNWFNKTLNIEQMNAVKQVLTMKESSFPYIIYGPPGTGKSVTLVELILQLYRNYPDSKLLVTAASNSAVDNLGVLLLESGLIKKGDMVRLTSYNVLRKKAVPLILEEMAAVPSLFEEESGLGKEEVPKIYAKDLGMHKITLGTLCCLGVLNNVGLPPGHFTHIIVDEAGQTTEAQCLIPIAQMDSTHSHLILAGDPKQLGPVVLCKIAKTYNMHISLLNRLLGTLPYRKDICLYPESLGFDKRFVTKLVKNYRALPQLVNMTSKLFYDGELEATISNVSSREINILQQLNVFNCDLGQDLISLLFKNVDGKEEQEEKSFSWFNKAEIVQVVFVLNELYALGILPEQIGIITPYKLQVQHICKRLNDLKIFIPKVGSVEEFQGQQKDIVILSLVKSNSPSPRLISFVTDLQRLNVALSRAKILNIIIGNKLCLSQTEIWRDILMHCHLL